MKTAAYASDRSSESSDWVSNGSQLETRSFGPQAERAKSGSGGIDLLKGPLFAGGMPVRAKLTIGEPNDKYEQEADRVAEQVMSMPDGAVQGRVQRAGLQEEEELQMKPVIQRAGLQEEEELQMKPLVQRAGLQEEEELQMKPLVQRAGLQEEEELQMKPLVQRAGLQEEEELQMKPVIQRAGLQEEEELQMKADSSGGSSVATSSLEDRLNGSKGGGSPLSADVRSFMEPRFGADFSGVRVHAGSEAVQMNREVGAQAFAHGRDVYFGAGKGPGNDALTAHELTHVVQQNGAQMPSLIQPKLNWDRAQLEARAGKKTGRSEEYKNIIRIVENYSTLMNPLAAPRGLQELIGACSIWLSSHQGDSSDKARARINAIQELMDAAKQELSVLTQLQSAPDPQAKDSAEFTEEASNSEFETDLNEEEIESPDADKSGDEEEHSYSMSPTNKDDFYKQTPSGEKKSDPAEEIESDIDEISSIESEQDDVSIADFEEDDVSISDFGEDNNLGEVIGEEGHFYSKNPKGIPEQKSSQADGVNESKDDFEPSFEDFNEKIEQPSKPKQEASPQKVASQEPEKQGLVNKLVAASNRLIGKLFRRKSPASKIPISTGKASQVKSSKKAAKTLTKEDYDEILAAIPKTIADLNAIAKSSKYTSLKRVGELSKSYETSEYYEEFKSSKAFTKDKALGWTKHLDAAEKDLAGKIVFYPVDSKEVKEAKAEVEEQRKAMVEVYAKQGIKADPKTGRADPKQFDSFKVKYLDKTERKDYEMGMSGGQMTQKGKPFDTKNHTTVFSGDGWAIYVMDPGGHFYSASHLIGQFHHSSFLAGGAVAGAGEWVVKNGRLTEITGKTGHYGASEKEMFQVLMELEERGFDLRGIPVTPFNRPTEDAFVWKQRNPQFSEKKQDKNSAPDDEFYSKTPNDESYSKTPNDESYSKTPNDESYSKTPNDKSYSKTPNDKSDANSGANSQSNSGPQTKDKAYEVADDVLNSPGTAANSQSGSGTKSSDQPQVLNGGANEIQPPKQEVDGQGLVPSVAQPAVVNTVTGHTGVVVSTAMVQAIRNDILATGTNSKWADEAEIVALAGAMGIQINIEGRTPDKYGASGQNYYLKYNGRDHYNAYLQVSVDPQTRLQQLQCIRIPGNGDCFYASIAAIQTSYGLAASGVSAMRAMVNQSFTDRQVADIAVVLQADYPTGTGLGANFRQLMQSGAANHIIEEKTEKK